MALHSLPPSGALRYYNPRVLFTVKETIQHSEMCVYFDYYAFWIVKSWKVFYFLYTLCTNIDAYTKIIINNWLIK